ncbi:unnamed protein product [Cuscuta campestris]|uniref:Mucin-like protein n=1 Tax=Cuscuta campestris TaxID=132261 RepID=A0A484MTQ5_9ASTE|nr:unnamed protein product [Cuscuta campestris]
MNTIPRLCFSILRKPLLNPASSQTVVRRLSGKTGDDEWNVAWEAAWLPEDLSGKNRAPWEADVNFSLPNDTSSSDSQALLPSDADPETRAFVEDMNDNWDQRKGKTPKKSSNTDDVSAKKAEDETSLYSLENIRKDYRVKKQRIHAGLWVKEIEKMEEAKLGGDSGDADDIEKLLDSASEIFDFPNDDLKRNNHLQVSGSDMKNKPDGWETTSKSLDGNIWEMSQREEDLLLQEFERRIAFNKFQIASFIKTHIFSRRRPIDGWKYMIEEIGPNARKGGKGSVARLPTLADASTQPFHQEETTIHKADVNNPLYQRRRARGD